jgi:hypothetical protein
MHGAGSSREMDNGKVFAVFVTWGLQASDSQFHGDETNGFLYVDWRAWFAVRDVIQEIEVVQIIVVEEANNLHSSSAPKQTQ